MTRAVLAGLLSLFFGATANAQSRDSLRREPLSGIRVVRVATVLARSVGDSALVRTRIELSLQQAGIRLGDLGKTDATVSVYCPEDYDLEHAAVHCRLSLTAPMLRSEKPRRIVLAYLWDEDDGPSLIARENAGDAIRSSVSRLTDRFLNDWMAANPRTR